MANQLKTRPFENFRTAITDPDFFCGRAEFLRSVISSPLAIRILVGGRRLGKTSTLHAIEWTLLNPGSGVLDRVFPVYVNLRKEAPESLENFFYILVASLRRAITRWEVAGGEDWRQRYRQFLSQVSEVEVGIGSFLKITAINPDHERKLGKDHFELALRESIKELRTKGRFGIYFLFDEGDYFVSRAWANDALSYFRALKDSSDAMSPYLGLVLSGFRGVRDYKHRIGSPLYNIGSIVSLGPLTESETRLLVARRCDTEIATLDPSASQFVLEAAGGHPYLTQQVLTAVLDNPPETSLDSLRQSLVKRHKQDFQDWWNATSTPDGFGQNERAVYRWLLKKKTVSVSEVAQATRLTEFDALEALDSLFATGLISNATREATFTLGAGLFADWVFSQV